jgi:hypothetical protein
LYGIDEESDHFAYPIKSEYTHENTIDFPNTHDTLHLIDLIGNVHKRVPEVSSKL